MARSGSQQHQEREQRADAVDVLPLLRAYREALQVARDPPHPDFPGAKALGALVEPRLGCRYFTERYVRRQVDAIARALARRIAVGEGNENDEREHAALERFQTSLSPPPSRLVSIGGLIVAIVLAQALLRLLVSAGLSVGQDGRITRAVEQLDVTITAQSVGDLASALAAGTWVDIAGVLLTGCVIAYVFARPLATGYYAAYTLLGRPEARRRTSWFASPVQQHASLRQVAAQLHVPALEEAVVRPAGAELRRDAPLDILAKTVLCLWVVYITIGFIRFGADAYAIPFALACAVAVGARLIWLSTRLAGRRYSRWWVGGPVLLVAIVVVTVPSGLDGGLTSPERALANARSENEYALPPAERSELRSRLAFSSEVIAADLREAELQDFYLARKSLPFANFDFANLRDANLRDANLRGASLKRALLAGGDLRGAELQDADLRCSALMNADLRGAELRGARFSNASYNRETRWPAGFSPDRNGMFEEGESDWSPDMCVP
jgi:hypothetical protein